MVLRIMEARLERLARTVLVLFSGEKAGLRFFLRCDSVPLGN